MHTHGTGSRARIHPGYGLMGHSPEELSTFVVWHTVDGIFFNDSSLIRGVLAVKSDLMSCYPA
jgi:hypothetical protein